jgi:hypothetical protein
VRGARVAKPSSLPAQPISSRLPEPHSLPRQSAAQLTNRFAGERARFTRTRHRSTPLKKQSQKNKYREIRPRKKTGRKGKEWGSR